MPECTLNVPKIYRLRYTMIIYVPILVLLIAHFSPALADERVSVAVIVNHKNPTSDLTEKELVKIFKLEKQHWSNGKKIYLILQEFGSDEKKVALKKIYRMKDDELKRYWLGKLYRGEISSFPKTMGSNESVKRFVGQVPNAIGFVNVKDTDDNIKTLRIEGKLPSDENYFLTDCIE